MWWLSALGALAWVAALPSSALAVDTGRIGLLSREAADVLAPTRGASLGLIALLIVGALGASLVGTWIGLRTQAVARIRDGKGWRELTYRFRSPGPLKVDRDLIGRMAGVLDDLEDLGRRFKTAPLPGATGLVSSALATAEGSVPRTDVAAVRFGRRGDTDGVRARWLPPGASAASPLAVPSLAQVTTAPAAPVRMARPAPDVAPGERTRDRATEYRTARMLLESGHDRDDVRRRTGLKLAEIDLLRCAPGAKS